MFRFHKKLLIAPLNAFCRTHLVISESIRAIRITHLSISVADRFLIVAQKETGNCYCVNLQSDAPWKVIAQLQAKGRLVDVVLYDDEAPANLKVLVLHATLLDINGTMVISISSIK